MQRVLGLIRNINAAGNCQILRYLRKRNEHSDGRIDIPMYGQTDGWTDPLIEMRSWRTHLKRKENNWNKKRNENAKNWLLSLIKELKKEKKRRMPSFFCRHQNFFFGWVFFPCWHIQISLWVWAFRHFSSYKCHWLGDRSFSFLSNDYVFIVFSLRVKMIISRWYIHFILRGSKQNKSGYLEASLKIGQGLWLRSRGRKMAWRARQCDAQPKCTLHKSCNNLEIMFFDRPTDTISQ